VESPGFTGERYVPGQGGAQIAYEHLHRYFFAAQWAKEKTVLDVATGTGYGASVLSRFARRVSAVDLDYSAVQFARARFGSASLQFCQADALHLPFQTSSMNLVVAFEVLEHVSDQKGLVGEIARVVRSDGLGLISTPDKATYTDARDYSNPYHVHELYREEFLELLVEHFEHVQLMTQQVRAGSLILSQPESGREGDIVVEGPPESERTPSPPLYLLALCSDEKLPAIPGASAFLDPTDYLFEEWSRESDRLNREIETLGKWGKTLEGTVKSTEQSLSHTLAEVKLRDEIIESLKATVSARDETIQGLYQEMKREISNRDEALLQLQSAFEDRSRWAIQLNEEVKKLKEHLELIQQALAYRILRRIGILPK
jgi:2-polyprenyl-3-methyl-5-hydroxy-6-metoxy-1,4-benzoquinol methylase